MSKHSGYQVGQVLGLHFRIHPFLMDDLVTILEVSRQRGCETRYRVQAGNGTRAGWVYESDLVA